MDDGQRSHLRRIVALSYASRHRRHGSAMPMPAPEPAPYIRLIADDRGCRWPLGEPGEPGFRFCAAPSMRGKSYCDTHRAASVLSADAPTPPPAPRKRPMADQRLVSIVDRLVRLSEERAEIAEQMKEVKLEARSSGYAADAVAEIVKRRLETASRREKREAKEQAVDLMLAALGDLANLPLGQAAMARG